MIRIILLLLVTQPVFAEIYKWTDAQGNVHFSDKAPQAQPGETLSVDVNTFSGTSGPSVTLYATSWCGFCKKARAHFKQNNIRYREYDIEKSPSARRRYKALGGTAVPLIVMGKRTMQGFNADRFQRFYEGR